MKSAPGPASSPAARRLPWVFVGLLLIGGGLWLRDRFSTAAPPPFPADLTRLELQLQAYVREKVNWVRERPRDAARHATLGMVYSANGLWLEALAAFENGVRLQPDEPLGHLYRAVALQELGRENEALQAYRQLVAQFPQFPQGYYRLGVLLLRQGDIEGAETAFRHLTELAPKEWRGPAGLGEVALRRNQFGEAAGHLEKAVALDPNAGNAHHLLGLAYRGLGRREEAEVELRLGLDSKGYPMPDPWAEQAPQHMKLLQDQTDIAQAMISSGQAPAAVRLLQEALRYEPTNTSLRINLASALNRIGQPQQAERVLLEVLRNTPASLAAQVNLALTYQALGKTNEALAAADRAVALATNNANARMARANALLAMERDAEAIEALEDAARLDPQDAAIPVQIGDIQLVNLGQTNLALISYQRAADFNPALAAAQVRLAQLHIEAGRTHEARKALDRLRRITPGDRSIEILEGRLARAEGRAAPAVAEPRPAGSREPPTNADSPR